MKQDFSNCRHITAINNHIEKIIVSVESNNFGDQIAWFRCYVTEYDEKLNAMVSFYKTFGYNQESEGQWLDDDTLKQRAKATCPY